MPRPLGRPAGALNRTTVLAREAAKKIVDDPIYRERMLIRAREGTLAPAVEVLLWHYRFGKPRDVVEIHTEKDLPDVSAMTNDQLAARAREIAQTIEEAQQIATDLLDAKQEAEKERLRQAQASFATEDRVVG